MRQNEETKEYILSKGTGQNFRKGTKWNRDKQSTWQRVQTNSHKCAHWSWEKNGWTQWEFQQRTGKYLKKKTIRNEEYNTGNEKFTKGTQ